MLVALAAGTLLGDAFIHLIPEALSENSSIYTSLMILGGVLLFFSLEKFLRWHHCHKETSNPNCHHPVGITSLIGDGLHNFLDGIIIAASFQISFELGMASTLAIILHEIPQEIGDFAILLHAGFPAQKAILLNFLVSLAAIFGVVVFFTTGNFLIEQSPLLLGLAAGGFIYIGGSDLIPELHHETNFKKSLLQFFFLVLGGLIMVALKLTG